MTAKIQRNNAKTQPAQKKRLQAKKSDETPVFSSTSNRVVGEKLFGYRVYPPTIRRNTFIQLMVGNVLFLALAQYSFGSWIMTMIAAVILLGALSNFLLPSSYEFTTEGVHYQNGLNNIFRKWGAFDKVGKFPDGVQLRYNQRYLREKILQGIFVYYPPRDEELKAKVVGLISQRIASSV